MRCEFMEPATPSPDVYHAGPNRAQRRALDRTIRLAAKRERKHAARLARSAARRRNDA